MNKSSLRYTRYFVAFTFSIIASVANASEEYSFGIVPQSSGSKLSKLWSPILEYVKEKSGITLQFATARNISTYEKRVAQGKYDFIYLNPYQYTKYHEVQGYTAFAKAKNKRLQGIVVVQKDSPYRSINDLDNSELAFPSHAFAANLVPRAIMKKASMSFTAKYVASHDSVYRNIARGRYPAGGGVLRTFNNTSRQYRDKLRVLWTSDGYTPHAFAASPRVPKDIVDKVQSVLLNMDQDPEGIVLLKKLNFQGIEKGVDSEWNDVRALDIQS